VCGGGDHFLKIELKIYSPSAEENSRGRGRTLKRHVRREHLFPECVICGTRESHRLP
jgi:hypothetical protein